VRRGALQDRGVVLNVEHEERVASARECSFAEALAALHELIGEAVAVNVGPAGAPGTFLTMTGTLARGYELGRSENSYVAFDVGEATLRFSPATLVGAWREECVRASDGSSRRVVALELRLGIEVEIEELRGDRIVSA
jgi:hypothetical protein